MAAKLYKPEVFFLSLAFGVPVVLLVPICSGLSLAASSLRPSLRYLQDQFIFRSADFLCVYQVILIGIAVAKGQYGYAAQAFFL